MSRRSDGSYKCDRDGTDIGNAGIDVAVPAVDLLLESRDAEINRSNTRGDEWHAAYETERHRADLLADQNNALIEVAKTVERIIDTVSPRVSAGGPS
jgi:hypothetical protein